MKQKLIPFILALFTGILPLYAIVPKQMAAVADGDMVELSITGFTNFEDQTKSDPAYWFVAGTASDNYSFQLVAPGTSVSSTFKSVYISTEEPGSLTYLKKNGELIPIQDGMGNAILSQDDYLTLDFYLLGTDNTIYHITNFDPFAFDETTSFAASLKAGDFIFNTDYFDTKKYISVFGSSTDNKYIDLVFYVNAIDPDITIPAGTYTINNTDAAGTMQASPGEVMQGGKYNFVPSFVATLNDAKTEIEQEWFITSGTATVTNENGKVRIVINATNSKGQSVTVEIGAAKSSTAIDETTAMQIKKVISNGTMRIISADGKIYDATGTQVR
ncbi:MAG: hypothetical protein II970_05805 [Paludibacteraceae bacterium]|nr:hypothetical protein [Paludibacteraceae bacterium]